MCRIGSEFVRISELRLTAAAHRLPPPLVDSPKCARCSLAGICLPDEVAFFRRGLAPRPLNPSADTALPLYVQQPGARVSKSGEVLVVEADEERLYIVTYDIADDKRWRRVFKLMHGYGRWLQLSVFQCRLTARRRAELARRLEEAIHAREDHVLILDLGPADKVDPRVESLGKSFAPVTRAAIVI